MKSPDTGPDPAIIKSLASARENQRARIVLEYLGRLVAGILGADAAAARTLKAEDQLFETGLSSLFIVELKNALEADFETELPLTLFFTHANVGGLVAHLLERVSLNKPSGAAAPENEVESVPVATATVAEESAVHEPDDLEAALLRKIAAVEKKL